MAAGIIVHESNTAFSDESEAGWIDAVASGDVLEIRDIFPPYSHGGLYTLVYKKLLISPDKDALADVAQGYGLTKDEAYAVINGGISPIFNNPDKKSFKLTKEDAMAMAEALREEYEYYKELYEIESEIDIAVKPSEIFSNGDLNDSGFDLVHDLHIIEEILFMERTETTVGQPFDNALDTPYLPTDRDETNESYIADEGVAAIYDLNFDKGEVIYDSAEDEDGDTEQIKAALEIGDTDVPVTVLSEDVCAPNSKYADALGTFTDENDLSPEPGQGPNDDEGDDNGEGGGGEDGNDGDGGGIGTPNEPWTPEEIEKELDVPADEWLKSWCPALEGDPTTPGAYGDSGFASLRGSGNSVEDVLNQANVSAGAATGFSSDQISAQIAICLNVELIWKKVSSFQPGDSCIACEVDQINTYMDKTLNHSMSPNKATGNLMETGKCKDGYGEFIDMQFITIAKPIPTPPNDDVVYGRNITEEWNEFIQNYQPEAFNKLTVDGASDDTSDNQQERTASVIGENATVLDLIDKVALDVANKEAEAKRKFEEIVNTSDAKNVIIHAQTVLMNLKQMTAYFKGYNKLYTDITKDVCPEILNKKST